VGQVSMFASRRWLDVRGCYDRQRRSALNLIKAELGWACALAKGGCMVIKPADMFRADTRNAAVFRECLICVCLQTCTSRPANSERYSRVWNAPRAPC
jgi:hypothetical protein